MVTLKVALPLKIYQRKM